MLTPSQKRFLRGKASTLKNKYLLGKNEINDSTIEMLEKALLAHELIKISVLKSSPEPIMSVALDLSTKLNAEIVQVIGRVIVLFKRNKENPKIVFEK